MPYQIHFLLYRFVSEYGILFATYICCLHICSFIYISAAAAATAAQLYDTVHRTVLYILYPHGFRFRTFIYIILSLIPAPSSYTIFLYFMYNVHFHHLPSSCTQFYKTENRFRLLKRKCYVFILFSSFFFPVKTEFSICTYVYVQQIYMTYMYTIHKYSLSFLWKRVV